MCSKVKGRLSRTRSVIGDIRFRPYEDIPHLCQRVLIVQETQQDPETKFQFVLFIKVRQAERIFIKLKSGKKFHQVLGGVLGAAIVYLASAFHRINIGGFWLPVLPPMRVVLGDNSGLRSHLSKRCECESKRQRSNDLRNLLVPLRKRTFVGHYALHKLMPIRM